jgi:D-amino-acid dehydrogenase
MVDPDGCVRAGPALARVRQKFVGGLLTPNDETGDCFKFTNALSAKCRELGVNFSFDTTVTGLNIEAGRARGVFLAGQERVDADAVVVALGSYSPLLLRPYGITSPVYPVQGYSLTVPIVDPLRSPESTVMDETYKIAITRLGTAYGSAAWPRFPATTALCCQRVA